MNTLLLTLAAPLQSWGSRSRFATRGTELAPTKSGVVGLLAAALGLERTASLERFEGLRFGVRVDQPGRVERDFQTARTLDGSASMPLSYRHYLADAVFLAGLEGSDRGLLVGFADAVRRPSYPLYLGRRAFPPAGPIKVEVVDEDLETALRTASWRASEPHRRRNPERAASLEYLVETLPGEQATATLRDSPLSFDPRRREYGWRDLREGRTTLSDSGPVSGVPRPDGGAQPSHDPYAAFEEGQ